MPKLTKRLVETLPFRTGDYIVFDSEVNGFGVRVMPSGKRSYIVQYRNGGRTRRMVIGRHGTLTAEEARREAMKRLGEVAKGGDPSQARTDERRAPTVNEFIDRFIDEHIGQRVKPRTAESYLSSIRLYIRPKFGAFKIADITRADVASLHYEMRQKPFQANRTLMLLSKMFNTAELWGLRPEGSNPCRMVPKNRERSRERYLSPSELMRLGEVFADAIETGQETPEVVAAYQLLLLTGCRLSEIQTLKWEYVTPTHLELPDSKTGRRRIPLSPDALAVLDSLSREDGNTFVITGKLPGSHITDLQHPWRRLRKAASLDDVRIHDLRHTYASMAVMNGVDLLTIGKILGHSNYQTTMRYAHLADESVRRAAGSVSGHMAQTMGIGRTRRPALRVVSS